MKKIISGFLAIVMTFSIGTVAFASQASTSGLNGAEIGGRKFPVKTSTSASNVAPIKENNQEIKDVKDEVIATSLTIRDNEKQLNDFRKSIQDALVALRQKIAVLKENETTLTQAQIDSLKAALSSIKDARKALIANHKGKIASIYPDLRKARNARNYDSVKASFDAILAEQASRKADLQRILDSINSINI